MSIQPRNISQVELVAITAVSGNCPVDCAEINILRVLDVAGCPQVIKVRSIQSKPFFLDPVTALDSRIPWSYTEPLVVPYKHTEHYHGLDGFNDVEFSDTPDRGRVGQEKAWDVINSVTKQFPGKGHGSVYWESFLSLDF